MKGFPTNQTKLEIPYKPIIYHSPCDICIHVHRHTLACIICMYIFMCPYMYMHESVHVLHISVYEYIYIFE